MLSYKSKQDKKEKNQSTDASKATEKISRKVQTKSAISANPSSTNHNGAHVSPKQREARDLDAASRRSQSQSNATNNSLQAEQDGWEEGRGLLTQSNASITFVSLEGSIAEDVILQAQGRTNERKVAIDCTVDSRESCH